MGTMRGIYYNKQFQKYHARYHKDGKNHHIGRFDTPEEALEARNDFIAKYKPKDETKLWQMAAQTQAQRFAQIYEAGR